MREGCEELPLIVCDCHMWKWALEEKAFIQKMKRKRKKFQKIDLSQGTFVPPCHPIGVQVFRLTNFLKNTVFFL